jgi:membrane associated rhomboid family serine protease
MLVLFIFGTRLEHRLGSSEFLLYYFITGIGAGIATLAVNWYTGMARIPVVGASGAIFGVMLAYATFFPDTTVFVNFFIPLPARIAVLIFTAIEIFSLVFRRGSGVAHLTHLAGFVFGYLYFLIRMGINPVRVFFRRR